MTKYNYNLTSTAYDQMKLKYFVMREKTKYQMNLVLTQ
jgi:hypothetical protein